MFSSEIKETIYTTISLFLAAAVLGLVAYVMGIRSDLATIQNDEINTRNVIESYAIYNKYQNAVLYGEDVMAIIREFADTDVSVYVDDLVCSNGGTTITHSSDYFINKSKYLNNTDIASLDTLEYGNTTIAPELYQGIHRDSTYFSYLVFGLYDEKSIKEFKYSESKDNTNYSDVTGIKIVLVNDSNRLDKNDSTVLSKIDSLP